MKLIYHRRVQGEVDEAVSWYEEQRDDLGDDFFTQLSQALMQIQKQPESWLLAGFFHHWSVQTEKVPLRCAL